MLLSFFIKRWSEIHKREIEGIIVDHGLRQNSQKETLYEWHNSDPATNEEISRTWSIATYQDNIPNPFIIDNTLIFRAYFY